MGFEEGWEAMLRWLRSMTDKYGIPYRSVRNVYRILDRASEKGLPKPKSRLLLDTPERFELVWEDKFQILVILVYFTGRVQRFHHVK